MSDVMEEILEDEEFVLEGEAWVHCPYCGESIELLVDPVGGTHQEYIEDCEVCCRPWSVRVTVDRSGHAAVQVATLDE